MKSELLSKVKKRWDTFIVLGAIVAIGWIAHEYMTVTYASKDDMKLAGGQLNYVMSRQEAALVREIAFLEREQERRRLTSGESDRLTNLRAELKEMREVRKGK